MKILKTKLLLTFFISGFFLFGLAGVSEAANYYIPTTTSIVDGDTFCGGKCTSDDTIIIRGGARGSLKFQDFDGAGSYITITNENKNPNSRVVITGNGANGSKKILSLYNCKYVDLRGDNDPDLEYGIKVINDGTPVSNGTVWVYGESDHIKLSYLEVAFDDNTTASGIGIQVQDASLTTAWIFDTFEIHHNYIHDSKYCGMYLGHNQPTIDNNPYVGTFSIHDNLLEDLGSYGITYKGINGPNNYIYNNVVKRTGIIEASSPDDCGKHGIGVQFAYGSNYVEIYNNWVEKTKGTGLKIGDDNHLVHDNTICGCGYGYGTEPSDEQWHNGVTVFSAYDVEIYDNIIIQPKRYGIYGGYGMGSCSHKRNLIGDSGVGEAGGNGLVEGTGADANIYYDDVADFNFNAWSDNNDYSDDDFTFGTDTTLPKVTSFTVNPTTVNTNETITISYKVTDETGLKQVELYRKKDGGGWIQVPGKIQLVSGTSSSGSFTDSISTAGTYWYGVHVVDDAGNTGTEPSAVKVTVNSETSSCVNDIWVTTPVTKTTINSAIASAQPGDCVIIPNGTYDKLSSRRWDDNLYIGISGTSGNEIILKAETPGGVKFTGTSYIIVDGSYWIIKDFVFENLRSYTPLTLQLVIINIRGDYVRVTNNHFKNLGVRGDKWGGYAVRHQSNADNGEIDYNTFENWAAIELLSPLKTLNLHIHHNYFTNPVDHGADHDSAIHNGGDPLDIQGFDSNAIVEYNYFNSCNGDPETISSKISSATYRYNVFDGRDYPGKMGALVLREGDDSVVDSNYFYGMGQNGGGFGIRVYGENHKIINNYIEGSLSGAASLLIAAGNLLVPAGSGHVPAHNAQVLNNTIVNSASEGLLIGMWWPTAPYKPENLTFKNNIITQSSGSLVTDGGHAGTFVWENNLHYNQGTANYWKIIESGTAEPGSGITHANPNLMLGYGIQRLQASSINAIEKGTPVAIVTDDIDGYLRDTTNPDIGCDEYSSSAPTRRPITEDEVGVSWLMTVPTCDLQSGTCCNPGWTCSGSSVSSSDCFTICCTGTCENTASTTTCTSEGYQCCNSCKSGHHLEYNSNCPGQVCCESCFKIKPFPVGPSGISINIKNPITTSDFSKLIENVLTWSLSIIGSLALLMIIIGGIMYMSSTGDEQRVLTGKKIVTYAIIGLALILVSYSIIKVLDGILT